MGRYYELVLDLDETNDGECSWLVTAPEFPEVTTFGYTRQDACMEGRKAIEEAIAARITHGEDIPFPLKEAKGGKDFIEVPAMIFLKSALYMIMREQGKTRADLQRSLGWHREQVDRLFRLDHQSKLDALEAAFSALGTPLQFDMDFPRAA